MKTVGAVIRALTILIVVVGAVVGTYFLVVRLYPPAVALHLALFGRFDEPCSLVSSASGLRTHYLAGLKADEIRRSSSFVARDGDLELWATPLGQYWIPSDTTTTLPVLLGQQAAQIYGSVRQGDIVVDCGAHVGVYVRQALHMGASLVVAIEPAPDNVECLRRNFAQEVSSGRVVVYPKGVWDKEDVLVFHTRAGNSAGDSFVWDYGVGRTLRVAVTTIDKIVSELKLARVDFIKMDIKGAERQALAGAGATLSRYRPHLAVASEHLSGDAAEIPRVVRRGRADYLVSCGSCYTEGKYIRPEILFFR